MATSITTKELRTMPLEDLKRECATHRQMVAKMHMQIEMQKEKDTAKYRREKKVLARMETILTEKTQPKSPSNALSKPKKTSTLKHP